MSDRRMLKALAMRGALVAGILFLIGFLALPALATRFGPIEGCCRWADDPLHTFYRGSSVNNSTWNLVLTTRSTDLDPTDMSSQTVTTLTSNTDVWVKQGSFPLNQSPAWYSCTIPRDASTCNQATVTFNTARTYYEAHACQEVGHSVGLDHTTSTFDPTSCMWGGATLPSSWNYYSTHEVGHINSRY
jgi:hypothetical protein